MHAGILVTPVHARESTEQPVAYGAPHALTDDLAVEVNDAPCRDVPQGRHVRLETASNRLETASNINSRRAQAGWKQLTVPAGAG